MNELVRMLAAGAGPERPSVSLVTVRVTGVSPLQLDAAGTALDGAVDDLYGATVGDLAYMLRAGGLAVLIGRRRV